MTQAEFARRTDLSAKHVNQIAQGKSGFTADTALRFERVTGIACADWLRHQADFRTEQIRDHLEFHAVDGVGPEVGPK
jgi:plasmid maintenance system antidote protein VapI